MCCSLFEYLTQVYIPSLLIVILSWVSYWIGKQLLNSSVFKLILASLPLYYISMIVVQMMRGREVIVSQNEYLALVILVIISVAGIYSNWRYGLKKYEAYG